ncbi:fimbrial protein [Gallibacterium genomosp. 1]|uniref:fimbrial protein n=1 Tax=Gallibacterium genomosp. 1 TaxID=155515 RepID=UPI000802828A|nr:fimbrial protein [Gallibacterium genomosp. 1]OBW99398.1 hypothetical protein QV04_08190 [Gallibacterium genomosp. 1]
MKKQLLTTLITVGLGLSAQGAFAADSTDVSTGNINVTGHVKDMTCTVEGGADKDVELDTVQVANFKNKGDTAAPKQFEIVLKNCALSKSQGPITKVFAYFENEASKVDGDGWLRNISTNSPATGVGVQLLHDNGTAIKVTDKESVQVGANKVAYSGNSATLKYRAQYIATSTNVEPGEVKASVKYTLDYE